MLASNPAAYNGQVVRVEALSSVIVSKVTNENFLTIFEPGCSAPDAVAMVELDPSNSSAVAEFVNSKTPEIREAKLVVEGEFDPWATPGCFAPRFAIKDARVTLVSPVTSKPLPKM
jgi:hypothetical protein